MTKVCFIKLKETEIADAYSDPPLGLLSVIASAKNLRYGGKSLDLELLDMAHEDKIPPADIYALSSCTPNYPLLIDVAQQIKKQYDSTIIAGGPHFDVIPNSIWGKEIQNLPIDIICKGEGEYTFAKALKLLERGGERKTIVNQEGPSLDLDMLPFPAREFLDKDRYFRSGKVFGGNTFNNGNSTTMITSRGCPFECGFCASPEIYHRKVRYRSVGNIKKEIDMLGEEYGVKEIRFQDDCFALGLKRFEGLSEMLAQTGIRYRCSTRVDQISDEMLEKLWQSGCREIGFGIESAENHVLKILKKHTTVAQNMTALKKTKERGFRVRAFMMTGLPGETKDSASKMVDFLEETKPDVVTLTSFIPLPGCDIYSNPEEYGLSIKNQDWSKYSIYLKRESGIPFIHTIGSATPAEMEQNREQLKEYLFNKNMSNVAKYNAPYKRGE